MLAATLNCSCKLAWSGSVFFLSGFLIRGSSTSPGGPCLSDCAIRRTSSDQWDLYEVLNDAPEIIGSESGRVNAAIVIPALNVAATIVETLRAVEACFGVAKLGRVFVCDDASTDNTPKLAAPRKVLTNLIIRAEESYVHCARVEELSSYLIQFGFKLIRSDEFAKSPKGGRYFDLLYEKS
jgi:hypothetical protein